MKSAYYLFKVIVFVCFTFHLTSAVNELSVSDHDITFNVHQKGSFKLTSSTSVSETTTIYFVYSEGNILYPLPNDTTVENGAKIDCIFNVESKKAGHTTVIAKVSPEILRIKDAFVKVGVYKYDSLILVSSIIGWLYFICWSVSFYPQIIENYRRKSVVGLNFDFLGLNLTGFIAYSVFNIGLKYVREVQLEYHMKYPTGVIPVETNDVVFAVHAVFATVVTIGQCFIYERGNQLIAKKTVMVLVFVWATATVWLMLTVLDVIKYTPWLSFLYFFSYIKLGVTLTKYIPQVIYNYQRKSTVGWSIGAVLLDFIGGLLSIGQMFIIAYNYEDWTSIIGNFTKFGLGLVSISFDVIFMVQHYILYRHITVATYWSVATDEDSTNNKMLI